MRFRPASDQAMLVYLGEEVGLPAHHRALKLLHALQKRPPKWLRNVQPAYTSVMVTFDPVQVSHAEVEARLRTFAKQGRGVRTPSSRTVEIPVCYGGEFGLDLDEVAGYHGLTPAKVIELHSSQTYHSYFLGFAPGFAYLADLPNNIA
ncbi:MAG: carboxyltransferase domain-containing protein, partial [Candidatus Acidiferrum sp.]